MSAWIGVDLDGTLAYYDKWVSIDDIGAPVEPMVNRVKEWLREGKDVRIFTARFCVHNQKDFSGRIVDIITPIEKWCLKHIGQVLPITNCKDFGMIELWDDRCVQVLANKGIPVVGKND